MKCATFVLLLPLLASCHSGDPRGTADLVDMPARDDGGGSAIAPFDAGCSGLCFNDARAMSCVPFTNTCVVVEGGEQQLGCDESGQPRAAIQCAGTCTPTAGCNPRPSCSMNVGGADSCPIAGSSPSCCDGAFAGYSFHRLRDPALPAEVSAFTLDRFEVTVGRFRRFVEDGRGTYARPPHPATGANPHNDLTSWDALWVSSLSKDTAALQTGLASCPFSTWTDGANGPREYHPINCVTWFEAFAFCIWDGGRLPTEAEWNGAAGDGAAERIYPWSTPSSNTTIDGKNAAFDCTADGSAPGNCTLLDLEPVGSRSPFGDTAQHLTDLAGNVAEWTFDAFSDPPPASCVDCAVTAPATMRVTRGGSWRSPAADLRNDHRTSTPPATRSDTLGFRCAR